MTDLKTRVKVLDGSPESFRCEGDDRSFEVCREQKHTGLATGQHKIIQLRK